VLEIRDAVLQRPTGERDLDGLSLSVRRGEIVGLLGVEGNGQSPLTRVLASLLPLASGEVLVHGERVPTGRPGALQQAGVSVIPDERHEYGCLLTMTVAENLVYTDMGSLCRGGIVSRRRMRERAKALMAEYDIQAESCNAPMWTLSGGNQQRVVLARAMASDPVALVASQPTHGLDVGAIEDMTHRLQEAAASGVAVLLISTELEEILALADRIAVIYRGRIIGELPRSEATPESIGLLMGGRAE
jgi:simple sugar transport system ATP-binding protein